MIDRQLYSSRLTESGTCILNLLTLNSNSGSSSVSVEIVSTSTYATRAGFDANISVKGIHFDGDHDHPINFEIEGLFLPNDELARLCDRIGDWTNQPLDKLAGTVFEGEFSFEAPGQKFRLRFGEREDTISALNLVVTVEIESGRFVVETSFVTDQSCLHNFAQSLGKEIADSHN